MRQTIKFFALGLILLYSCSERPTGAKAKTSAAAGDNPQVTVGAATYKLIMGQMNWTASKPTGKHLGTVDIKQGEIAIDGEDVVGGIFTIDMTSLVPIDLEGEKKSKLESHLKSQDFFSIDQHPKSAFKITGADLVKDQPSSTHNVSGDLTIKETTKNTTIPINISFVGIKF
ncbi:MAG: YceI family protein [Saprospiraceae bacterium]|nr:YceI family protein [Saprospiraceae bacterium]